MKNNRFTAKIAKIPRRRESGQAMVMVLVLLVLGSLVLAPVLSLINNSLKNGQVYQQKTDENYAAKSGIEDATWQIRNDQLPSLFHSPDYEPYDYNTVWSYYLDEPVNGLMTNVSVQNIWLLKDIPVLSPSQARAIIESNKLMVTGDTVQTGIPLAGGSQISRYEAKYTYYPDDGEDLTVAAFGVWLPRGFSYYTDATHKSSLETSPISGHPVMVATSQWAGNQAVIWNYASPPHFDDFPSEGVLPVIMSFTFYFKCDDQTQPSLEPYAVPWIKTGNGLDYGIPYSWNADIKVYKVRSAVGETVVESYFAKSELRQLQQAIAGDYYATGNSNLSDSDGDHNRETWHDPSTAAVTGDNIPTDADVAYAFLYWSGWENENAATTIISDPSGGSGSWPWTAGSLWSIASGRFQGRGDPGGTTADRTLTAAGSLALAEYAYGTVTVSMELSRGGTLENSDALYYAISNNGGSTWSGNIQICYGNNVPGTFSFEVPKTYAKAGFMLRFYQTLDSSSEHIYINNLMVTATTPDTSVVFKINDGTGFKQVYLDASGEPKQGSQELNATRSQVLPNYSGSSPHGFSYSSFCDVTKLVRKYSQAPVDPAVNWPGYATYSVGGIYASASPEDEWAYANWSLIIIYTSPATQGHQLYLFDNFIYSNQNTSSGVNVDFDGDGEPGGYISGFIVPPRITGVAGVTVSNGGYGYTSAPTVTFVGNGTGAKATAEIANGKVTRIIVTNAGQGYTSPPSVILTGGGGGGAAAQALLDANAAKLTTYMGEGDVWYQNDYIAMNGVKLWDGTNTADNSKNNPDNVFNSTSLGLGSYDGIDIDTLGIDPPNGQYITWDSHILSPGDTYARIDMVTHTDIWNMIYIIISFRSETSMGGILSYRIINGMY
ncbi:MAG: hypothetical protein WC370_10325 [Dehalococcoidales bacterium]|jgi:hypothetical protein